MAVNCGLIATVVCLVLLLFLIKNTKGNPLLFCIPEKVLPGLISIPSLIGKWQIELVSSLIGFGQITRLFQLLPCVFAWGSARER